MDSKKNNGNSEIYRINTNLLFQSISPLDVVLGKPAATVLRGAGYIVSRFFESSATDVQEQNEETMKLISHAKKDGVKSLEIEGSG
ncbi:MAG TPA: hypothetical protein GXX62_05615 [Alcaligenaceae bacterium]|nr:hypothetical protein [Alcaligenaceae bacterium]